MNPAEILGTRVLQSNALKDILSDQVFKIRRFDFSLVINMSYLIIN